MPDEQLVLLQSQPWTTTLNHAAGLTHGKGSDGMALAPRRRRLILHLCHLCRKRDMSVFLAVPCNRLRT